MSDFILDCSVAIAWCIEDEASSATDALLDRLEKDTAFVPSIWFYEVSNVLIQAERRKRLSQSDVALRLDMLRQLSIEMIALDIRTTFSDAVHLARAHSLSSYDAAYLNLAIRKDLPLATLDKALRRAAETVGITTLPF